jgi:hypothetical protein
LPTWPERAQRLPRYRTIRSCGFGAGANPAFTVDLSAALGIVRAKFNIYELQSYAAEDADWRVYDEFG